MPGGVGCCCCNCFDLDNAIACNAITMSGWTRSGPWQNWSGFYGSTCCYRATFTRDDCPAPLLICQECLPTCTANSRYGRNITLTDACVRDVIIYRHYYTYDDQIFGVCPQTFLYCRYFVLVNTRQTMITRRWFQSRTSSSTPWVETCPFDCTGIPCGGQTVNGLFTQCETCQCDFSWWRVKWFDTWPAGTLTFTNSDVFSAASGCANQLRCMERDVLNNVIAQFVSTTQCCGTVGANHPTRICDCNDIVFEPFCPSCTTPFSDTNLCVSPPPSFTLSIGSCP